MECGTHRVHVKDPLAERCQTIGEHPIGVRGVDVNSGDYKNTKYRSRLAAKDVKVHKHDGLFAATPPVDSKRLPLLTVP